MVSQGSASPSASPGSISCASTAASSKLSECGSTCSVVGKASAADDGLSEEMRSLCKKIDADSNGRISRWELLQAVESQADVALVLVGHDGSMVMSCEDVFDKADCAFSRILGSKDSVSYAEFACFWQHQVRDADSQSEEVSRIFALIDKDDKGTISKLALLLAVERSAAVAAFVLPGMVKHRQKTFEAVHGLFEAIAGAKRRVDLADFQAYFQRKDKPSGKASIRPGKSSLWAAASSE